MHAFTSRSLMVALTLLATGTLADAATIVFQPSNQDAFIDGGQPNHIFGRGGTGARLFVRPAPDLTVAHPKRRRSLVRFDIALPPFSTINSATLEIYEQAQTNDPPRTHGVHRMTSDWAQTTVKWGATGGPSAIASATATQSVGSKACVGGANAGAACASNSECPGGTCTAKGYKSFDVTTDVQSYVNGASTNFGWMVKDEPTEMGGTAEEVGYSSREDIPGTGDPEWRPRLTINYTAPSCITNADCTNAGPCTTNPHCTAGHCAVDPVNCDDGNACTDDFCDPQSGCAHPLANCDDGFSCTIDGCDPNTLGCTHTPVPSVCTHNGCQTGTCVADENNDDLDPVTGCQVTSVAADGTACNADNDACTTDTCAAGECAIGTPTTCTAPDQCHDAGTCNPLTGLCTNAPPKNAGTPCDDNDACTQIDQCNGSGTCVGGNSIVCSANDQCHDVGTCNPGTGLCSNPPKANGATCNDGNACTQVDQCNGSGTCVGSNPVICTALDQCHDPGICSPGTGLCSNPNKANGSACNDGNACTQTDTCQSGACSGTNPVVCTALDQCHDVGTCAPGTGLCSNPNKANGSPCSDNDACTQTDTCQGGSCSGGNPVVCTALDQCHDVGTCAPGTGLCSNPNKANGSPCSDNDACTQIDTCQGGSCSGTNPVVCTALDQCHDVGTCAPGTGMCSNPAKTDGAPCNDSDACTQTDQCTGGACVGGNPVVCTALDQCHDVGTCDTGTGLCSNPTKPDTTACNDGNACTLADACAGGQCIGNPQTCGDGIVQGSCNEECDDPNPNANCTAQCRFICGPTPQANCRLPVITGKGLLLVKNKTPDKKDVLVWKWMKGAATTPLELGTPLTSTGYTICVYDASANPQPLLFAMAPPAGTCTGKPCWTSVKNGFKYKDKDLTPDGLSFLLEKAGAAAAAKLIVKGKGANLGAPGLPLTTTVTVQLKKNDDPGICWQSKFSTPIKNLPDQFKAHAD